MKVSFIDNKTSLGKGEMIGTMYPNHHSVLTTFQIFSQRSYVYTCKVACMADTVL